MAWPAFEDWRERFPASIVAIVRVEDMRAEAVGRTVNEDARAFLMGKRPLAASGTPGKRRRRIIESQRISDDGRELRNDVARVVSFGR